MNVISARQNPEEINKKIFKFKSAHKDGLVLQIHHTIHEKSKKKNLRFLYSTFNPSGSTLAVSDINGNIFIIDFSCNKFWSLPSFKTCSVLSFSKLHLSDHLIVGIHTGPLYLVNIHLGTISAILEGHKFPVKNISYAETLCLTASQYEAIIYDLNSCSKVHKLELDNQIAIKQIFFVPVAYDIVACFSDDYIQVWKSKTFQTFKRILPTEWKAFPIKSMACTRNGTIMLLSGHSPTLVEFSLDSWILTKILNLPQGINSVRSIDFISQNHDAGANKFLVILSNDGVMYFLNMEKCIIVSKIQKEAEIIAFSSAPNGSFLACILHSGEANIYKATLYLEPICTTAVQVDCESAKRKLKLFLPAQKQPREDLDPTKLREILKSYGEYPAAYRALIWAKLLCLPNNTQHFTNLVRKGYPSFFKDVDKKYPLMNKTTLKNLKRLMSNLGNWCPVFRYIDFVPLFVFPFLKVFENDPVACFEAVVTIFLNWCQHWFEYAPCAPINILAIIENMLTEHDPQLLLYLVSWDVTSHLYAWSLLEVAFSEVLNSEEWCILWDHILSTEPAFLLTLTVAYNILNRSILLEIKSLEEFQTFYHNQNPIRLKSLIAKTHYLLNNTSKNNHPRKYFKEFSKLPKGSYPIFDDFPKAAMEFEDISLESEKDIEHRILELEEEVAKLRSCENEGNKEDLLKKEEKRRLQEVEDVLKQKVSQEKERLEQQKKKITKLQTDLKENQAASLEKTRTQLQEINTNARKKELNKTRKNVEQTKAQANEESEDLSKEHQKKLKPKSELENLAVDTSKNKPDLLKKDQQSPRRKKEISNKCLIHQQKTVNRTLKVSAPKNASAINKQAQNTEMSVTKKIKDDQIDSLSLKKIKKMEKDTKELESEVEQLLKKFTSAKKSPTRKILPEDCPLNCRY